MSQSDRISVLTEAGSRVCVLSLTCFPFLSLSLHRMRTQPEDSFLQTSKAALTKSAGTLILGLQASRTMGNKFMLLKTPIMWCFVDSRVDRD